MPHVKLGGSRLYYESHGEGPPLVLLHGAGGNHASWFHQVPVFARTHRVLVVDQRGFGLSEDLDGEGRSAMAGDLLGLLDHLGIGKAALIGQSLGGGTCVALACAAPERVAALLLADTVLGLTVPEPFRELSEASAAASRALTPAERVLGPTLRSTRPDQVFLYLQISSFNRYNARNVPGAFPLHEPAALAATGIPTLFLVGADDVRFPTPLVRGVQAAVAGSRYAEIPEAGHSAYFEQPERFNALASAFLTETWPGQP